MQEIENNKNCGVLVSFELPSRSHKETSVQFLEIIPTYFKFDYLHPIANLLLDAEYAVSVPCILKFGGERPIS